MNLAGNKNVVLESAKQNAQSSIEANSDYSAWFILLNNNHT